MRALSKQSHVREREMKVGYREVFDLKSHPGSAGGGKISWMDQVLTITQVWLAFLLLVSQHLRLRCRWNNRFNISMAPLVSDSPARRNFSFRCKRSRFLFIVRRRFVAFAYVAFQNITGKKRIRYQQKVSAIYAISFPFVPSSRCAFKKEIHTGLASRDHLLPLASKAKVFRSNLTRGQVRLWALL